MLAAEIGVNPADLFFRKPFTLDALVLVFGQSELSNWLEIRGARPRGIEQSRATCEEKEEMACAPR
jgi:hypothetical protein